MQKNNRSRRASAASLLVAIVAFLNASCSSKVSSRDTVIPAAVASSNDDMQPLRIGVLPTQSFKDIFGRQSAGYTSVEDADYTPIRKLRANLRINSRINLKLKSEKVQ